MNANWTFDHRADGTVGMVVLGDVDMAVEEPFVAAVEALLAGGADRIDLDLSDVDFMDSAGLRTLMRLRNTYVDRIAVAAVSGSVERLFEVAGVTAWLMSAAPGAPGDEAEVSADPPSHGTSDRSGAA